jgi:hypothetical protein
MVIRWDGDVWCLLHLLVQEELCHRLWLAMPSWWQRWLDCFSCANLVQY